MKDIPTPRSTVAVYKFDHVWVPHVIWFTRSGMSARIPDFRLINEKSVILMKRRYRHELSADEAGDAVREYQGTAAAFDIRFSGHPRKFLGIVFQAYKDACTYKHANSDYVTELEKILDLLSQYDPRKGLTYNEFDLRGWD